MINSLVYDSLNNLKLQVDMGFMDDDITHCRLTNGINTIDLYLWTEDFNELAKTINSFKKEKPDVGT